MLGMAGDFLDYLKNSYYGSDMNNISIDNLVRDMSLFAPAGLAMYQFLTGGNEDDWLKAFGLHNLVNKEGGSGYNIFF